MADSEQLTGAGFINGFVKGHDFSRAENGQKY
jgi:hypothetical protein